MWNGGSASARSGVSYSRPALAAFELVSAALSRDTIGKTRTSGDYDEIPERADEVRGNLLERPAESPEPERDGG